MLVLINDFVLTIDRTGGFLSDEPPRTKPYYEVPFNAKIKQCVQP